MAGAILLTPGKLNNRQDPVKLGQVDPKDPQLAWLTLAENVDIDNADLATRRGGRTRRYTGTPHSFFVHPHDDQIAYFVEASTLKKLNTDFTATTIATLQNNLQLSYEVINGEVVVSNSGDIGWVSGTQYTPFTTPSGTFELAMPAGQHIAFDHGDACLLVASGAVIYRSKPYNAEVRDARFSEFPMNGYVRMLASVEDGWWVATEKNVSFVQRSGGEDYTFVHISDNPPPDGCFLAGWEETKAGHRRFVTWASIDGFCIGRAGGVYENISPDVALPAGETGYMLQRVLNGIRQYVAIIREPENVENFTAPSLNVNTIII